MLWLYRPIRLCKFTQFRIYILCLGEIKTRIKKQKEKNKIFVSTQWPFHYWCRLLPRILPIWITFLNFSFHFETEKNHFPSFLPSTKKNLNLRFCDDCMKRKTKKKNIKQTKTMNPKRLEGALASSPVTLCDFPLFMCIYDGNVFFFFFSFRHMNHPTRLF